MLLQLAEFEARLNLGSQLEAVIFSLHAAAQRRELTGSAVSVIEWLQWIARPLYGHDTPLRRNYDGILENLRLLRAATEHYGDAAAPAAPAAAAAAPARCDAGTQTERDGAQKALRQQVSAAHDERDEARAERNKATTQCGKLHAERDDLRRARELQQAAAARLEAQLAGLAAAAASAHEAASRERRERAEERQRAAAELERATMAAAAAQALAEQHAPPAACQCAALSELAAEVFYVTTYEPEPATPLHDLVPDATNRISKQLMVLGGVVRTLRQEQHATLERLGLMRRHAEITLDLMRGHVRERASMVARFVAAGIELGRGGTEDEARVQQRKAEVTLALLRRRDEGALQGDEVRIVRLVLHLYSLRGLTSERIRLLLDVVDPLRVLEHWRATDAVSLLRDSLHASRGAYIVTASEMAKAELPRMLLECECPPCEGEPCSPTDDALGDLLVVRFRR
jgi:hypothetical protein